MMQMRFRKPEVVPTLLTVMGVGMMLCLGIWQLERLAWKEALIERVEIAEKAPPVTALPTDDADILALEFTRAALPGTFLHHKSLYQAARYNGTKLGFHLITPFRLEDGRVILVDRGWVPSDKNNPADQIYQPSDDVILMGMVRTSDHKRRFTPDNKESEGLWLWRDLPAMQRAAGVDALPVMIDEMRDNRGGYPIGNDGAITLLNNHLGYAITWFMIAAAGLLIYLLYHLRPKSNNTPA